MAGDEFLLELAVAGRADAIVTHNVKHFDEAGRFGIPVMTPREFLGKIEGEARSAGISTLAEDLYKKAAELAAKDHFSVEEFVSVLLANRVGEP